MKKTKDKKTKRKIAVKFIDWDLVADKIRKGCNGVQTAAFIGVHYDTLARRCKEDLGTDFTAFMQEKKAIGDTQIAETQFDLAINEKNFAMLIWLGKNRLGQKDKQPEEVSNNVINVVTRLFKKAD